MLVVLNKVDLLPPEKKKQQIEKMTKKMLKTLENTCFANSPVIPVAAKPGGPDAPDTSAEGELKRHAYLPERDSSGQLLYSVDHCFGIKGQGTVMTGTMLRGKASINDTVEIPSMQITRKIKSMQMFRQPVESATMGDRVGICVTQFDPKLLERGLVCAPGSLPTIEAGIISVKKISYFRGSCATKAKFHVTMGHETVMARLTFFGGASGHAYPEIDEDKFSFGREYVYQDELLNPPAKSKNTSDKENKPEDSGDQTKDPSIGGLQWALLEFEKAVTCPVNCLVIGSKLDTDIHILFSKHIKLAHSNTCRLAFHGRLLESTSDKDYAINFLPRLRIFKTKSREGIVDRMTDEYNIIGRGLFKKETNIQTFVGLKVKLSTGENGVIEGGFGQSGKFKIRIPDGLKKETSSRLSVSKKKGKKSQKEGEASTAEETSQGHQEPIRIYLQFKRYIYDSGKQMVQT
ncbi:Selenocysteine-specific elongation factor [Holothuria leucospilota]|uniref:Selenocysteine-specific elongation factor n=1 Tax=Holothuria leucospilota TaxID=206669 RepID=A0A9Q1CJA2_HOLLE|nr:Selenocysteine-specific elongation factor [Holothuria leucospilota]